ncbi:MAG: tRNA (cytidine(34)-2'-O)-methyltransferase [Alphaproteobacteria bacterium]
MRLCLYRPDIPQNLGTLIRTSACLNIALDIIKPCAFPLSREKLRRSAMDYIDLAHITIHESEDVFWGDKVPGRTILLTTKAEVDYREIEFRPSDILIVGRESAGVPPLFAQRCDCHIKIPMASNARSLNVAIAASMVLGEALRQTTWIQKQ